MFASLTETIMAPTGPKDAGLRPSPLRPTNSFPRTDAQAVSPPANRSHRATTLPNGAVPDVAASRQRNATPSKPASEPDTFESVAAEDRPDPPRASVDLDDLPIELVSLTDR